MLIPARTWTTMQAIVFSALFSGAAGANLAEPTSARRAYLTRFPNFNPNYETDAPGDVDTKFEASLSKKGQFPLVQREFELYAWQLFIALNQPSISSEAPTRSAVETRWMTWATTEDLAAAASRRDTAVRLCQNATSGKSLNKATDGRKLRTISTLSADDILKSQGFPSIFNRPLIDQHGHFVFYESLIDPNQVSYLCKYNLLRDDVRRDVARSQTGISFPLGTEAASWSGSFSLKLAWKILDASRGDVPARFLTSDAQVLDLSLGSRPVWRAVKVGLVAMHVVHKSQSAPERIWATFEHVDNLQIDTVLHPELQPSFSDPQCPLCSRNLPDEPVMSRRPTQVSRVVPIPTETEVLNQEAQSALQSRGSILQYYKLVGVQWPGIAGDATSATPSYVANVVMETFIQPREESVADSKASKETRISDLTGLSCMSCHARASALNSQYERIPTGDGRSDGDFAWFLSQSLP